MGRNAALNIRRKDLPWWFSIRPKLAPSPAEGCRMGQESADVIEKADVVK
jgi:hypothetical protein